MTGRLFAMALVLTGACSTEEVLHEPDVELNRMLAQPRADAYQTSDFFADGRVMRAPPPGTFARETLVGDPMLIHGYAEGRYAERYPVPVTRPLLEEGRERFDVFCAACHGILGDGVSVVAANMKMRRPPSLHEPRIRDFPPGRMFRVITEGFGFMPSYAAQLTVPERWAVVAYIEALQLSRNVPAEALPPETLRRISQQEGR